MYRIKGYPVESVIKIPQDLTLPLSLCENVDTKKVYIFTINTLVTNL